MKIVLLPGLDGTGELFSPLLNELAAFDTEVIKLPDAGPQDYASLTEQVVSKLPEEDFILIAESFSGPIGLALAKKGIIHLKGVIFVATFLSAPSKPLLSVARYLPLKQLSTQPFSKHFLKALFIGNDASDELLELFQATIKTLPSELIQSRLQAIHSLVHRPEQNELPAAYIQATSDKLVSADKVFEFSQNFSDITIEKIEGPHFILQARPQACALIIAGFALQLK